MSFEKELCMSSRAGKGLYDIFFIFMSKGGPTRQIKDRPRHPCHPVEHNNNKRSTTAGDIIVAASIKGSGSRILFIGSSSISGEERRQSNNGKKNNMTESSGGGFFDFHAVKNEALYAPLTAPDDDDICGVGMNLALVHDPPMYDNAARAGTTYRYVNRVSGIESHSPAERAGLRPGDIVVRVDGTDLDDGQRLYLPEDVAAMTRGPEGSRVAVVVDRHVANDEYVKVEFVLTRAPIGSPSCATRPGSPLPTSTSFMRMITPEADRALDSFEDRTGIDLRNFF
jgi:hypothetical protein